MITGKGRNREKYCDVQGCLHSVPLLVHLELASVSNPEALSWCSISLPPRQLDFCPAHAEVVLRSLRLDLNVQLAATPLDTLDAMARFLRGKNGIVDLFAGEGSR